MLLALFFQLLHFTTSAPRVKRQWGPADFYQFEQWVNYVNRPRQNQFSADTPRWGVAQYPGYNRNIQPHNAPNGWNLEQNPYIWPAYGRYGNYNPRQPVYPQPRTQVPTYPQGRTQPPVLIETNVFRPNSLVPVPPSIPSGYGIPHHLQGVKGIPITILSTTPILTTTSTIPTTTEDERERFIQTAVREDIDKVEGLSSTTTSESTAVTFSTTGSFSGDMEAAMNTRLLPTTTTTIELSTTAIPSSTEEITTSTQPSTKTELTTTTTEQSTTVTTTFEPITTQTPHLGFIWTEGESSPAFANTKTTESAFVTSDSSSTSTEISTASEENKKNVTVETITFSNFSSSKENIPESEETFETSSLSSTTRALFEDVSNDFHTDFGLRSPPLPIDVAKKLQEMGMSIDKLSV